MTLTPRSEALAAGAKRYRGKVCAKHPELEGERQLCNKGCLGCHRSRGKHRVRSVASLKGKREAARAYRTGNRERILEQQKEYRVANRERILEQQRGYHASNRQERNRAARDYGVVNRGRVRENRRSHYVANREGILERARVYHAANPERKRDRNMKRRALKREAGRPTTKLERRWMRAICRTAIELGLTVDHVMPIAGCRGCGAKGLHEPQNMALLSQARNASKGARCMRCWARDSGRSSGK